MPNGRCRYHGGLSTGAPKGNKNRLVHGIYSAAVLPDEADLWDHIAIGSLDDDIRIAKLQLRRALIAQNNVAADGLELSEESSEQGEPPKGDGGGESGAAAAPAPPVKTIKRRRASYDDSINRLLGRIGDLEQKRSEMLENSGGNKANAEEQARKVREAAAAMRSASSA